MKTTVLHFLRSCLDLHFLLLLTQGFMHAVAFPHSELESGSTLLLEDSAADGNGELAQSRVAPAVGKRQEPISEPPAICAEICQPISSLLNVNCPVQLCCTEGFHIDFFACLACIALADQTTNLVPAQEQLDKLTRQCGFHSTSLSALTLSTFLGPTPTIQPTDVASLVVSINTVLSSASSTQALTSDNPMTSDTAPSVTPTDHGFQAAKIGIWTLVVGLSLPWIIRTIP